ncbi:MAG: helix-turn-helix transcriptional regulator [Piscinibacter sp.]|nr:helix-turn-helix transcriptional regulator [Piscinibacter sp.]
MPKSPALAPVDPLAYAPTPARPLRAKLRRMSASARVEPHDHPWAQVAFSTTGVIRMNAAHSTYLVPPSRALWIPPGVEHTVTAVEDAEIRTLYLLPDAPFFGDAQTTDTPFSLWPAPRVLEVSPLLRELVAHLDIRPGPHPAGEREQCLAALILDELRRAAPVRLGVDLPRDKRLRQLCEAVLETPTRWATLEDWAGQAGASPRTVARLFRTELGTTFQQWRQQVLLAHALGLSARKLPMATIAAELGYASASAFSAMVRRTLGAPPSHFFA